MFFCSTLLTLPQNPQLNYDLQAARVHPGNFILFIPDDQHQQHHLLGGTYC